MGYIDVFIPLAGGVYFLVSGEKLVKSKGADSEKKKKNIKTAGMVLIGVSVMYLIIKLAGE